MAGLTTFLETFLGWFWKAKSQAAAPPRLDHGRSAAGGSRCHPPSRSFACRKGGPLPVAQRAQFVGVVPLRRRHPQRRVRARRDPGARRASAHGERRPGRRAAEDSLLAKFHYLSTVSGGGYIGSWLSAWRRARLSSTVWQNLVRPARRARQRAADDRRGCAPTATISRPSSASCRPTPGRSSPSMCAILWSTGLVILPVLCAGILALKFAVVALTGLSRINFAVQPRFLIVAIGVAFLLVSLSYTTRNRPSRRGEGTEPPTAATTMPIRRSCAAA